MSKRVTATIVVAAGLISVAAFAAQEYALDHYDLNLGMPEWLWVQLAAGWLFLFAGLATARGRPETSIGKWMVALALVWLIRLVLTPPLIQWETIGMAVAFYGILFVILYGYPEGHLTRWERWAAAAYLVIVTGVAYVDVAFQDYYGWVRDDHPTCCPSHLLFIEDLPGARRTILSWAAVATAVALVAITFRFLVRWKRSSSVGRKGLARLGLLLPVMVLLVVLPGASALASGFSEAPFADTASSRPALYVQNGALVLLAGIMAASLIGTRMSRARVADLMDDLAQPMTPSQLQQHIRNALADQSALLGFRREATGGLFGVDGREIETRSASDSQLTDVGGDAVILHDQAVDDHLVRSVGSAAHLALENARLQAELRAQLEEVNTSRLRLVTATDQARRAVERDLHDGAQQRLVALAATLRKAHEAGGERNPELERLLDSASAEANLAIEDLRNLARGVHPAILSQAGLGPAIDTLVDRSEIAVTANITDQRFGRDLETTAYFVVAEALANAAKHSGAQHIEVSIQPEGRWLVVIVSDDGQGGADAAGSGLGGLEDRVAAVGGSFDLNSESTSGTRLMARLPISSEERG